MKRSQLSQYRIGSRDYVIAHAHYQHSKGRGLSAWYRGVRNPTQALLAAAEPMAGDNVSQCCKRLTMVIAVLNRRTTVVFNGITIAAVPGMTARQLLDIWQSEMDRQHAEYLASAEYAKQQEDARIERERRQVLIDAAVACLMDAKVRTHADCVTFVRDLAQHGDWRGVTIPFSPVCELLGAMGYRAKANTNADYNHGDAENSARYLVGQALDAFGRGMPPHPMIGDWATEWLIRFSGTLA